MNQKCFEVFISFTFLCVSFHYTTFFLVGSFLVFGIHISVKPSAKSAGEGLDDIPLLLGDFQAALIA